MKKQFRHGYQQDDVEIVREEVAFQGFFQMKKYRLRHRLFDGGWSNEMSRELFERGHAVVVMPYDPQRDELVFIEQFRIGALENTKSPWLLEFVAGMYGKDESAEEVARREVIEEIGCEVSELEFITDYLVSPGGTSERITIYCGKVDATKADGIHGVDDENEDIRVIKIPLDEALELLLQGEVDSAAPIIALQWLQMHREELKQKWLVQAG